MRRIAGCAVVAATLCGMIGAERPSPFTNQSKPGKASATMLAISSSSRQSFAGNQEIYLADLAPKGGEHRFARIIDQYPGYGLGIRDSLLRNRTLFSLQVTREPECDLPGSQIFLPASERVIFDASVHDSLQSHQTDLVPCYRAIHGTIRIVKK